MTETEHVGHRRYGSGAEGIRIQKRADKNPGYHLFIGRKLWQEVGMPERIALGGVENAWTIEPHQSGYSVVNVGNNGMPRISVGATRIQALGLTESSFTATYIPTRHLIVFQRLK